MTKVPIEPNDTFDLGGLERMRKLTVKKYVAMAAVATATLLTATTVVSANAQLGPQRDLDGDYVPNDEDTVENVGTIVSTGRPATQSSTWTGRPNSGADAAVDGQRDGGRDPNQRIAITDDDEPWWELDLETWRTISGINIWNRTDGGQHLLDGAEVLLGDEPFGDVSLADARAAATWSTAITTGINVVQLEVPDTSARYVRIQLAAGGTPYLGLAEVDVLATTTQANLSASVDEATIGSAFVSDGTGYGVPEGFGYRSGPTGDAAHAIRFDFHVTDAGTYQFVGTVRSDTTPSLYANDSFWVTVDGTGSYLWDSAPSATYVASTVNNRGSGVVERYLDAGPHTVTVWLREDGTHIAALELVNQNVPGRLSVDSADATVGTAFRNDGIGFGVPNGVGSQSFGVSADHSIRYEFDVVEAGTYRIVGMVRSPNGADDSFWVTVNDDPAVTLWDTGHSGSYRLSTVRHRGSGIVEFDLDAGANSVTLWTREDGTYVSNLTLKKQG